MDELARRIREVDERAAPGWDQARVESTLASVERRLERRRARRRAALVSAPLLLLAAAAATTWLALRARSGEADAPIAGSPGAADEETEPRNEATPAPGRPLRLADGSTATPEDERAELVPTRVTAEEVRVRLDRGGARFEVTRDPERTFTVEAGPVAVVVVGTRFAVRRVADSVEVEVFEGQVRVEWETGAQALWAGGRGLYPPPAPDEELEPAPPAPGPAPDAGPGWRALAERGEYGAALEAIEGANVGENMGDLLLAADVMRYSRRPDRAATYLRRAVDAHPDDGRAPLATFTLGRLLLHQLGRPGEAAEAFGRAQTMAPFGPLAEDALAREVEAWHRAGDQARARERALRYVDLFPDGQRLDAVRRHGGLEP